MCYWALLLTTGISTELSTVFGQKSPRSPMSWVPSGAAPLSDLLLSENDVMSYRLKIADLGIFSPLFLKKIQTFLFLVYF